MLKLQIVWPDGDVVQLPAGGVLEKNLIEDVMDRVRAQDIGLLKNKKQVCAVVETALQESINELKSRTKQGFK